MRDLLAGIVMITMATGSAQALDLDEAVRAKLQAGEAVTSFVPDAKEAAAGVLEAVIDIPASAQAVWTLLTDCSLNVKVFNGLKGCKVLRADAGGAEDVREHTISWSRLLPTLRSVFKSHYTPMTSIQFEKTEGDLKKLSGSWTLQPLAGNAGTRLFYKADIAVGIPVPSTLVKLALESDMPKTMSAIRKAAIEGLGGKTP